MSLTCEDLGRFGGIQACSGFSFFRPATPVSLGGFDGLKFRQAIPAAEQINLLLLTSSEVD